MDESEKAILNAFLELYARKYRDLRKLGRGSRGTTYLAREVASGTDVVVKLPFDSLDVPEQRDFRIPRLAPSRQYADLYTVEPVDRLGYATVSRYVRGVTWEVLVERIAALRLDDEANGLRSLRMRLAVVQVCATLATAAKSLHDQGYGHGDVHQRNIIVADFSPQNARSSLEAVLIDLGNASLGSLRSGPEQEERLMAKDLHAIRGLALGLKQVVPHPEFWTASVTESQTIVDLVSLFERYPKLLGVNSDDNLPLPNDQYYNDQLRALTVMGLVQQPAWQFRFRQLLNEIAETTGTSDVLRRAHDALSNRIRTDPRYPAVSIEHRSTHVPTEQTLRQLVSPPSAS